MDDESQAQQGSPSADVVALIESALMAVRRDQSRRRPPGPWGEGPFGRGGPHAWGPRGPWGAPGGDGGHDRPDRTAHGRPGPERPEQDQAGQDRADQDRADRGSHDRNGRDQGSHDHNARDHGSHDHDHPPFGDSARPGPGRRGRDGSLGRIARIRMLEALETAEAAGSPLSISSLAQAIGVDQPRASRLVQEGVERGHVRRVPDPSDARRALIQLTAAGRSQLEEVRTHRRSAVESALAEFTPAEARTFAELFDRFVRAWPRP